MRKVVVAVLAGWGLGENHEGNPLSGPRLKNFSDWLKNSVAGALTASGPALGLDWQKAISAEEGFGILGSGRGLESFSKNNPASQTLGEILSEKGLAQIRIAEESYSQPTGFCFDGFRYLENPNDFRIYIANQKNSALSAAVVRDRATLAIRDEGHSFILTVFGGADLAARAGNFASTAEAAAAIDNALGVLAEEARLHDCEFIIVGSHGNAEVVLDRRTGQPDLENNPNPVPIVFPLRPNRQNNNFSERLGLLSDVAPTILGFLDIPKPKEMTGENLAPRLKGQTKTV